MASPYAMDNGCPVMYPQATLRAGNQLEGAHLLQDINLLETISHITHERIPERVVHAKCAGVHGNFKLTDKWITEHTKANFLKADKLNIETPLFARFSTAVGERGSADSVRDTRGFAFKLYTDEGNLDWVFSSTPTFPIRDGGKFPSFVHCQKRDPRTGLRSVTAFWDFMSKNPETFNTLMHIFSDSGTPKSYRHCDIFSVNTYKFVTNTSFDYVRITLKTQQGEETLTQAKAEKLAGEDPNFFTRDLYTAIDEEKYPKWDVIAQVATEAQAQAAGVNIYDPTRRWPTTLGKTQKFGEITLNRNAKDEFGEVKQASFSPAAIVPGWAVSADPILQTRLSTYSSAARYRLGINFHQLEVNKPKNNPSPLYNPTKRDRTGYVNNFNPNPDDYIPNDGGMPFSPPDADMLSGKIYVHESQWADSEYDQPRALWNEFKTKPPMDTNFVSNVALNLKTASMAVRTKTYEVFEKIDHDLSAAIMKITEPGHMSE